MSSGSSPSARRRFLRFIPGKARFASFLAGAALAALLPPGGLVAQEAVVRVEENFRAEPNGSLLGMLVPGTRVEVLERSGEWTRATLRGFIWEPSVQDRPPVNAHDLVVAVAGGENLRDAPSGRIAARLHQGTVLQGLVRDEGWVEVRRTGWIWSDALEGTAGPLTADTGGAPAPGAGTPSGGVAAGAGPPSPAPDAVPGGATVGAAGGAGVGVAPPPALPAGAGGAADWLRGAAAGTPILSEPDGSPLGDARPGAELRVVAREGNWARVQLEGWVWIPGIQEDSATVAPESPAVLTAVRADDLSREPERYRGRLVELRLQYISLERAEQVRTDFREGEPFLLTRSTEADRSFVYVAVPPDRMEEAGRLTPLETIRVIARVRAGAAAFTGSPILDLVELERIR